MEVAQVALQGAGAQGQAVVESEEVLAIEVLQVALVVLGLEILAQLIVEAGEIEAVAVPCRSRGDPGAVPAWAVGAVDRQVLAVALGAALGAPELADDQVEAVDFLDAQLGSLEGLWQQAPVVGLDHRQARQQRAEARFAVGYAQFPGQPEAAEFVPRAAIALQREQRAGRARLPGLAGAAARVQAQAEQAEGIDADADRAFGEAGLQVEPKALAPLLGLAFETVAVVMVEVEVAQVQRALAALDEAVGQGLFADQQAAGKGRQGQAIESVHGFMSCIWRARSGPAWSQLWCSS
ncbi:hypothetical protein FQZ97_851810 [compost metagenome]